MSSAERRDVAITGRAAVAVRDDVVLVASLSRTAAPREDAGRGEQRDLGVQPVAHLVSVDRHVVGEVSDGQHREVGVGSSAPLAHLLLQDRAAGGLVAADHADACSASSLRWTTNVVRRLGLGAGFAASRAAAASGSASTPTARERRTSRESRALPSASSSSARRAASADKMPLKSCRSFQSAPMVMVPMPVSVSDSSCRVACRGREPRAGPAHAPRDRAASSPRR